MSSNFTRTQQCLLATLSDGRPHPRKVLHQCLYDELGGAPNLRRHICDIRKKLPAGQAIVCVLYNRMICYQHVRTLERPEGAVTC